MSRKREYGTASWKLSSIQDSNQWAIGKRSRIGAWRQLASPVLAAKMVIVMPDQKSPYTRSLELLSRNESKLLVVDVQEKLVPKIFELDRLLTNCRTLIQGAKILGAPVYATEQYPEGAGEHAVPQLAELLEWPAEKLRFSCAEVLAWDVAAG